MPLFTNRQRETPTELMRKTNEEVSVIQDRKLQQAGFEEALRQGQEHLASKFTKGDVTYEDSQEMSNVKFSEQLLLRFFSEQKLASEENVFQFQLTTAKRLYQQLIENCRIYERKHILPWSAAGRARKRMVQQIRKIAVSESKKLESTASVLQKRNQEDGSWADVLGSMRVATIDLTAHETEMAGGGTSDVTVIKYPNTKLFYKKEEKLLPLRKDMRALIDQKPEWEPHRKLMTKLLKLIDNENSTNIGNIAIGSYGDLGIFLDMVLKDMQFSPEEQAELATFMPSFAAAFKKLNTRYGVAKDAGIEFGEDLSKRNVATSRMASLLGLSGLVTDSASVTLKKDQDSSEKGIVTVMAKGQQLGDILNGGLPVSASPKLLKEFMNLQILDTICGQVDRNASNLFFTYEEKDGKRILNGVTGIDSDMAFGVRDYDILQKDIKGYLQLKPLEQNGECLLPHLDETLCENILALNKDTVFFVLSDLLNPKELDSLWKRIESVKTLLRKSRHLMTSEEWPNYSSIDDLKGKYGVTYVEKILSHLK